MLTIKESKRMNGILMNMQIVYNNLDVLSIFAFNAWYKLNDPSEILNSINLLLKSFIVLLEIELKFNCISLTFSNKFFKFLDKFQDISHLKYDYYEIK